MDEFKSVKADNETAKKQEAGAEAEAAEQRALPARKKRRWRIILPAAAVILLAAAVAIFFNDMAYAYAKWRFDSGDYSGAKPVFESLRGFNDSQEYLVKIYYGDACGYMKEGEYTKAIDIFAVLDGYADSPELINECFTLMADDYFVEGDYGNATACYAKTNNEEGIKKASISWGDKLFEEKDYSGAIKKWKPYLGDEEIDAKISRAEYELAYLASQAGGDYAAVIKLNGLNFDGRAHEAAAALLYMDPLDTTTLAVSDNHIVYLAKDGSVRSGGRNTNGQCEVEGWEGVVSLCASSLNTYGLKYDGTVLAAGSNAFGQCGVSDWTDIIALCAADNAVFGLKSDGTVVFKGGEAGQYDAVSAWSDIAEISAGKDHIAAVAKYGRVFAAGNNEYRQLSAAGAENIVSAVCGPYRTIIISADGKVSVYGACTKKLIESVSNWTDIVDLSSSYSHIVARDRSGRLFAAGENGRGQCEVSGWEDIALFAARADFTVAVRYDGSVMTSVAGHDLDWNVLRWK